MKSSTTKLMGIINITPNSFSDGGKFFSSESAREQFNTLLKDGSHIIDIGAESTGPNSKPISVEEEISRLDMLCQNIEMHSHVISIDTYKSETAKWALTRGAKIINDVSGLRADPKLVDMVAEFDAKVVIMYAQMSDRFPHASLENRKYENIFKTISSFFEERIEFCVSRGIKLNNIMLDPGMGSFISSDSNYSWELIRLASQFVSCFPDHEILYGVSRKGFTKTFLNEGHVLKDSLDHISKCIELELIRKGVHIIRTHNVGLLQTYLQLQEKIISE